jgi:probable F420-dependent oxidoreductase
MLYGDRIQDTSSIERIVSRVQRDERAGMATMWSSESARDPFLPLAIAAGASTAIALGTGIAVAYARSPYATAQSAWDLQRFSGGRFRLGLATQVRAHVERRFGMPWPGGVGALRDYILCCRAIWHNWQHGGTPDYVGETYRFTLTNPEFRPEPFAGEEWRIPLWIAAVGARSARLAGELGEGLHIHAFHTPRYLSSVVLAAAAEGRSAAGRSDPLAATCPVMSGIVHDEAQERELREAAKGHIAFYASTPAYLPVLEAEGLEELHAPLRAMSREKRWGEMAALIDNEVVDLFAVFDEPVALARRLRERYDGILTELALYRGGDRFATDDDMAAFLEVLAADSAE